MESKIMNKSRNMLMLVSALVFLIPAFVAGQRPSFAGSRPIGFPDTPNRTTTTPDPLGNRFGEGTTQRLPIEANGDRDLVDRLSKLPLDKQPFWFINWQALEDLRKNPQTYPQKPNTFVDPIPQNANTGVSNRFSTTNPGLINTNTANSDRLTTANRASFYPNSQSTNSNVEAGNRNGFVQTTDPSDNANTNSNDNIGNRNGFGDTTSSITTQSNANSNVELGHKNAFEPTTNPVVWQNVANTEKIPQYYPLKGTNYHHTFSNAHAHAHSYFYHTTSNYQENNFHSI